MLILAHFRVPIGQQQKRTGVLSLQNLTILWGHSADETQKAQNGGEIAVAVQGLCEARCDSVVGIVVGS